jgi:hypothetical protein
MTNIKNIAKYNLENGGFNNSNLDNKGLSIAVDKVVYDENDTSYDYIILVNGNRAMDVTKDGVHPFGVRDYVKRICDYLKNKKRNYVVEHILLDNDAPLMEEAKIIASHVDLLSQDENVNTVNLIGHSKGGTIMFNIPKFLKNTKSLEKTSITTTATPFRGCLLASPKIFLEHVKKVVYGQLPPNIAKYTYEALVNYYKNLSSDSHMDNDIALPGYESDHYDPNFIAGMFDPINIRAMQKIRFFQNYVTWIDDYTIVDSLRRGDFTSVGMCLLDKFFMSEVTDGFVETKSQQSVSNHMEVKTNNFKSRTHYFLTHDEDLAIVLDSINEKILEFDDMKKTPSI